MGQGGGKGWASGGSEGRWEGGNEKCTLNCIQFVLMRFITLLLLGAEPDRHCSFVQGRMAATSCRSAPPRRRRWRRPSARQRTPILPQVRLHCAAMCGCLAAAAIEQPSDPAPTLLASSAAKSAPPRTAPGPAAGCSIPRPLLSLVQAGGASTCCWTSAPLPLLPSGPAWSCTSCWARPAQRTRRASCWASRRWRGTAWTALAAGGRTAGGRGRGARNEGAGAG